MNDNNTHYQLVEIAELVLAFGKVNRRTEHPDGTPESDTTHTVMLGIICTYLNHTLGLGMNNGLIAQLALVHDLHEAICGDEPTLWQDPAALEAKRSRESTAIEQVTSIPGVRLYHDQVIKEARFVRAVDKLLPKLTHLLNNAKVLKAEGMSKEDFHQSIMVRQYADMEKYVGDIPEVLALHKFYGRRVEDLLVAPEPEIGSFCDPVDAEDRDSDGFA
jgi:putative hydrolase of HD superfamily